MVCACKKYSIFVFWILCLACSNLNAKSERKSHVGVGKDRFEPNGEMATTGIDSQTFVALRSLPVVSSDEPVSPLLIEMRGEPGAAAILPSLDVRCRGVAKQERLTGRNSRAHSKYVRAWCLYRHSGNLEDLANELVALRKTQDAEVARAALKDAIVSVAHLYGNREAMQWLDRYALWGRESLEIIVEEYRRQGKLEELTKALGELGIADPQPDASVSCRRDLMLAYAMAATGDRLGGEKLAEKWEAASVARSLSCGEMASALKCQIYVDGVSPQDVPLWTDVGTHCLKLLRMAASKGDPEVEARVAFIAAIHAWPDGSQDPREWALLARMALRASRLPGGGEVFCAAASNAIALMENRCTNSGDGCRSLGPGLGDRFKESCAQVASPEDSSMRPEPPEPTRE